MRAKKAVGKVWILGAGPGDPELLTVKAMRVLEAADLILFDHLVSAEIRVLFPVAIPAFYVGKKKGQHSITQKELNGLMIRKAREGKNICRVKGGDPYVFGRGGEEALDLIRAGIEVEVVPGITSAAGCAAYAGIPLTHRGLAQGCTFVTAHGETEADINWAALAQMRHTLVFYMGLSKAAWIQQSLLENRMSRRTPVAFIENGCRKNQRLITGCLFELADLVGRWQIESPALILVGDVVDLAAQLNPKKRNCEFYSELNERRLTA